MFSILFRYNFCRYSRLSTTCMTTVSTLSTSLSLPRLRLLWQPSGNNRRTLDTASACVLQVTAEINGWRTHSPGADANIDFVRTNVVRSKPIPAHEAVMRGGRKAMPLTSAHWYMRYPIYLIVFNKNDETISINRISDSVRMAPHLSRLASVRATKNRPQPLFNVFCSVLFSSRRHSVRAE